MPCGGGCHLGTPTILRSRVRRRDEEIPARTRTGVPGPMGPPPLPSGTPKTHSAWVSEVSISLGTQESRAGERSLGGCLAPVRYPPEQTGEGMTRGTEAAAAAAAAPRAATAAAAPEA